MCTIGMHTAVVKRKSEAASVQLLPLAAVQLDNATDTRINENSDQARHDYAKKAADLEGN